MVLVMVMVMVMVVVVVSYIYDPRSVMKWAKTFQETQMVSVSRRGKHSKTVRKI